MAKGSFNFDKLNQLKAAVDSIPDTPNAIQDPQTDPKAQPQPTQSSTEASSFLHPNRPSVIDAVVQTPYVEMLRTEGSESQHAYSSPLDKIVGQSNEVSQTFVNEFLGKMQTLPQEQRAKVADALSQFGAYSQQIESATEQEREIWKTEYAEALSNNDVSTIAQNNPFAKAGLLVAAIDADSDMKLFAKDILHHINVPEEIPSHRTWKTHPVTKVGLNSAATGISFIATYAGIKATLVHLFNSNPEMLDQFNQVMPGALSANNIAVAMGLLGSGLASYAIYGGRNAVIEESFMTGKGVIRATASAIPKKPWKMGALAVGLGLSTMYADVGVTNIFANMHITEQTGRKAQNDPRLQEAIKNAQEVRERLKQYLSQFKDFLKLSAKLEAEGVEKLLPEERKQYDTMVAEGWKFPQVANVGAGPIAVTKGYFVGLDLTMDPKFEQTGRPKFEEYKNKWDKRSTELGLESPDISKYAEKLLAGVNIEETVQKLEAEIGTITNALKQLDEQAAWNTIMAVAGISRSDAYTIPNSVRMLEKAIIDASGEVIKLNTDVIPKIEQAYAEAMKILYGDASRQSLTLKRPNISLQSLPGAPGEYWKNFRTESNFSLAISPETAEAANAYLTRFGVPPEAFKTNYFWAYIAFISTIYLLVDAGVTAWISRHERKRKEKFDEEVPDAIDKLSDTEDLIAEQTAILFNNKLSPLAHSLLGMSHNHLPTVSIGYVRSRMRATAIEDVPELKQHQEWISSYRDGDETYLAELSIRDRDAFNAYTEWLEQWKKDIEVNPTKLAGLFADLYPQYEKMLSAFSDILNDPAETFNNIDKMNTIRESVRGIHRETLRDRAQLLAKRIAAANVISAQTDSEIKSTSVGQSMEQLRSPDITLPLKAGERISFTLNQARAFLTYQTTTLRREADIQELEQVIRSGNLLEFTAFTPNNTRQGLTVPAEFTAEFLQNTKNSFSADDALLEGMQREQENELFGRGKEADPDAFSEQLNYLNKNGLEKVRATIAQDMVLSRFELQTTYNTESTTGRPTVTLILRNKENNEMYVQTSYPGRVPHLGVSEQELNERFLGWFEQSGHAELLAKSFMNAKKIESRTLNTELLSEFPEMKVPVNKAFTPDDLGKIVRFNILNENIAAMEERLAENLVDYPLSQSDIDAFYDENISITGNRSFTEDSIARVFNEINQGLSPDTAVEFDITTRKLHIYRPAGAGNAEIELREFTTVDDLLQKLPPVNKK